MIPSFSRARRLLRPTAFGLIAATAVGLGGAAGQAAETPAFTITFNDGVASPAQVTVPAGTAITLSVTNKGTTPAEFESKRLRAETVIAPGATVTINLRALPKGSYAFFDEFHPDNAKSRGEIVAQ